MDKISVIIPSYNSEASIERAIRSAALQSYPETEILAVDDASKDGTAPILRRLEKEIPQLRVIIRETNGGVSAARNTGIKAATGKWLVTLDGDDYIEKEMLQSLYDAAYRPAEKAAAACPGKAPAELSICGIRLVFPDHTEEIGAPAETKLPAADFLSTCCCALWDMHLLTTHSNKLYDLELIKREGLCYREDLRINEDIDFVFRYLAFCKTIAMTKGAYMDYVQHDAGKSNISRFRENGLSSSLSVLEDYTRLKERFSLSDACVSGMERRLFVHILSFAGLMYYRSDLPDAEKLARLTESVSDERFRKLLSTVKPCGMKEQLAASLLKRGRVKTYHSLCRILYQNKGEKTSRA